jgi:hypothetical protein
MIGLADIKIGMDILEKLAGWVRSCLGLQRKTAESVAGRFFRLFESHGVHRNQIPRFFEHGLELKDVQDEASLLPRLTEAVLQDACDLFGVRREWLDGAEATVYACHDFYKDPHEVAGFLAACKAVNPDGQLCGILLASEANDGIALIVLYEAIRWIGDKPIYRYHLLNNWVFDYWKSRAYLAACVAIAWKHRVYIRGEYVDNKMLEALAQGTCLVGKNGEGLDSYFGKKWYPEDMSLKPDVFLKGVDLKDDNRALPLAIELWLRLDKEGFMDSGLEMYNRIDVRQLFMAARVRGVRSELAQASQ